MLKLVYGCLAFSLVACVILFTAAAKNGEGFRGMTKTMNDAIANGATVLDADRYGAITQTGNGKLVGYTRDGRSQWSLKFDRFAEGPSNPYGAGAEDALAWCIDDGSSCPGGLVHIGNRYESVGNADPALGTLLTGRDQDPAGVLALPQPDQAFVRTNADFGVAAPILAVRGASGKNFPIEHPKVVQPRVESASALVGAGGNRVGKVAWLKRENSTWRMSPQTITEKGLQNACSSEVSIATISARVRTYESIDAPGRTIGEPVKGGVCSFTYNNTVTVIFNSDDDPGSIQAANYTLAGHRNWTHNLGAQRLLSPSGSPFIVTQKADSTLTVYSVYDCRVLLTRKVNGVPFVGPDGSVVTAGRDGQPIWIMSGKGPATHYR